MVVDHSAAGINLKHAGDGAVPFTLRTGSRIRTFEDVGMWGGDSLSVVGMAEPEEVPGVDVTDGVLPMMGARPVIGRIIFTREDDRGDSPLTVILSYDVLAAAVPVGNGARWGGG